MEKLIEIFATLHRWRHLPHYQLERRLDILFTPYLPEILQARVGKDIEPTIIPEFPLKQSATARSTKVDYVLFAQDQSEVYFVELKTDRKSHRAKQKEYLEDATTAGFPRIIGDLLEILGKTSSHQKYYHLLNLLVESKQIEFNTDPRASLYPEVKRGYCFERSCVNVLAGAAPIRVIYIEPQPIEPGPDRIDFNEAASIVERHNDPLSRMFATYLRRWQKDAAISEPE